MRSATQSLAGRRRNEPRPAIIRLSAALGLGAAIVQAEQHTCCRENCVSECGGCLLKMALAGSGGRPQYQAGYTAMMARWPWTERSTAFPCACKLPPQPVTLILGHLFDEHMLGAKDWPLGRIVRWVETAEREMA